MNESFAPNRSIDAAIKELLASFSDVSQARMKKAIRNAGRAAEKHRDENTDAAARHIFREFVPASILNQNGYSLEYEKPIQGKTPDWLDDEHNLMIESYTFERGSSSPFLDRVLSAICQKCDKYHEIIASNSYRFLVAVHLDFISGIQLDDCENFKPQLRSAFDDNPSLWAILFFSETQVITRIQQYGFYCICRDESFISLPNWPFKTASLNPDT